MNICAIEKAIGMIRQGMADKISVGNVTVYRVANIIRVDIKEDA